MNGRMLLSPDINENYFGNCSFYVCLPFLMSDLTNFTVNELAQRINMEKRKFMKREYILSALAFIDKYHRTSMIHLGWESSGGIDLSFNNWSRFPLYKCDFGQGQPKAFKIPPIRSDGLIFILPTLNNDEIQLHISLKYQHAQFILNELV
jgi:shikimate O-hydroxycinnamoyltransferase